MQASSFEHDDFVIKRANQRLGALHSFKLVTLQDYNGIIKHHGIAILYYNDVIWVDRNNKMLMYSVGGSTFE